MEPRTRKIVAAASVLVVAGAAGGFALYRHAEAPRAVQMSQLAPAPTPAGPAATAPATSSPPTPSAPAPSTPPPAPVSPDSKPAAPVDAPFPEACLRKGITVKLAPASLHVSGPPALTIVTGEGVEDEINFSTKDGLAKGCAQPEVTAKAVALDFDAMDKQYGVAASWRAAFCKPTSDKALQTLCQGDERPKGQSRRLALAAIYDPKTFNGEAMFPQPAPDHANFAMWKAKLIKANTPPPVQADGAFDIYPGNLWLERDGAGDKALLFTCDIQSLPASGPHYCIGTLGLDNGLTARIEFRTTTSLIGAEALAAEDQLNTLLAGWK
jgi:hypothetical protein